LGKVTKFQHRSFYYRNLEKANPSRIGLKRDSEFKLLILEQNYSKNEIVKEI